MALQVPAQAVAHRRETTSKKEAPALLREANLPDHVAAQNYAINRLRRELPDHLLYHSLSHTQSDVVPAVERLALLEKIDSESLILVRTAAFFHDIGFVVQCKQHEDASIQIAAEALPLFHYTKRQIQIVQSLIATTRLPQTPHNLLEQIIADADLDVLGRADFLPRSNALRTEILLLGLEMNDIDWYTSQLRFLTTHRYFTRSAFNLRHAIKLKNIAALERRLNLALSA